MGQGESLAPRTLAPPTALPAAEHVRFSRRDGQALDKRSADRAPRVMSSVCSRPVSWSLLSLTGLTLAISVTTREHGGREARSPTRRKRTPCGEKEGVQVPRQAAAVQHRLARRESCRWCVPPLLPEREGQRGVACEKAANGSDKPCILSRLTAAGTGKSVCNEQRTPSGSTLTLVP